MKYRNILYLSLVCFLNSCGIQLNVTTANNCLNTTEKCEECNVVPSPGLLRDVVHGYYYDKKENRCKQGSSSSDGVKPPFKTMEECLKCCCR